jgi:DNA-binding NarL/FixJ family response regulator
VTIRVLIADDQALVRTGMRMILDAESDLDVVAEARHGAEAVDVAIRARPDIALMDIRMPVLDGLEATRRLMRSARPPRVVMLTTFDLDEYLFDALHAGASGFLLKDVPPEQLVAGIRTVHEGDSLLAPAVTSRLIQAFVRDHPPPAAPVPELADLTPRELDILKHVARGLSNAEIAGELVLSTTTVKTHVGRVLAKLGLRDRVQAVVLAYETGIIRAGASPPRP